MGFGWGLQILWGLGLGGDFDGGGGGVEIFFHWFIFEMDWLYVLVICTSCIY